MPKTPIIPNLCDDRDVMFIIMAGIRYCMGRNTYAPRIADDFIKRYWHTLDDAAKGCIRRDVAEYVDRLNRSATVPSATSDTNWAVWVDLCEWMQANP